MFVDEKHTISTTCNLTINSCLTNVLKHFIAWLQSKNFELQFI